jgi:hypothetical protein
MGEAVIGQFYLCPHGCGKPKPIRVQNTQRVLFDDDDPTPVIIDKCPFCGSHDIAPFADPYQGAATHCIDCGRVWK